MPPKPNIHTGIQRSRAAGVAREQVSCCCELSVCQAFRCLATSREPHVILIQGDVFFFVHLDSYASVDTRSINCQRRAISDVTS